MKNLSLTFLFILLLVITGCKKNSAPVIEMVSASPEELKTEETTLLSSMATDEDGDLLSYIWTCPNGTFPDGTVGQSVEWKAPDNAGVFMIKLIVGDGVLTDEESIQINVEMNNTPPVASFNVTPENGSVDDIFEFDASNCSDDETISNQLQVRWDWENDGVWDTEYSTNKSESHQFTSVGTFTVKLEVKDEGDLTATVANDISVSSVECIDPDGRVYTAIQIGTQTWMSENMAYLPSVSSSRSGSDSDQYYYVHGYEGSSVFEAKATSNYTTYGVLYNWEAARKVCPIGWHLPTDEEWITLEKNLGMSSTDANKLGMRYSGNVGKKLKSKIGWNNNGNGDNSSGLNVFPGENRSLNGGFGNVGGTAYFWSSSEDGSSEAWYRSMIYDNDGVFRSNDLRRYGFSVRCLKN